MILKADVGTMLIQNGNPLKRDINSFNGEVYQPVEKFLSKTKIASSFRFTISLDEPDENVYPEYDYSQILNSAQEKRRVQRLVHNETNCDEIVEEVLDISRFYQKKYGHHTANRVIHSAGYDDEDPLIGDSDICDENVPNELTDGKFHVNTKSPHQISNTVSSERRCLNKTSGNSKKNFPCGSSMKTKKGIKKVCKAPSRKAKNK